jgi:hypothetical protein
LSADPSIPLFGAVLQVDGAFFFFQDGGNWIDMGIVELEIPESIALLANTPVLI